MRLIYSFLVFLFAISSFSYGQLQIEFSKSRIGGVDSSYLSGQTTRKIPGIEYEAGWLHEFFFGSHWRDVWTTSVDADILDLDKFACGLTPSKRTGGKQTKTLRLKGADGNEYRFRSVDKDPKFIARHLEGQPTPGILKDQVSASHPFSALVIAPLLDAVGVLNAHPVVAVMPDDPRLGEFSNEFANMLGEIEIVPSEKNVPGSDKVINSDKLLKQLDEEYDETVDSKEFLKARLIDILVGDWDRPRDQWVWARFHGDSGNIYRPIPKDRDNAFTKFDGIAPRIATKMISGISNFGEDYPSMKTLTWMGRYLDQLFLVFLDRHSWDSIAANVQSSLTDDVLENAVKQLPPPAYRISKEELLSKLKSRRDNLMEASAEFYELVNSVSDIFGTNKHDFIEIKGSADGTTEVAVYKGPQEIGGDERKPLRSKVFQNYITTELRIYLKDGDDKVLVSGKDNNSPLIRIIGGDGNDELVDNSDLPVRFYDPGNKTKIKKGENTSYDDEKYEEPWDSLLAYYNKVKNNLTDKEKEELEERINDKKQDLKLRDRGHSFGVAPYLATNPDYGVLFGGSINLTKYGFRSQPYVYKMQLKAGYAPKRRDITGLLLEYKGIFRKVIGGATTNLHIRYSGLEVNNFFGFGNQTP